LNFELDKVFVLCYNYYIGGKLMKMLIDLLQINSPSGNEDKVRHYIKTKLAEMNIDFAEDETGNIFNLSLEERPLLSAHMDTVRRSTEKIEVVVGKAKSDLTIIKGAGPGVIGGDDKCGVWIILDLLSKRKDFNFIFTVQEEIGAAGAYDFCGKYDLKHITFGLVLDRAGSSDIICLNNGYGTKEFETALSEIGKKFKYKPSTGVFSDANVFRDFFSCANLSVGYYNQHSPSELICVEHLQNAEMYVEAILDNLGSIRYPPVSLKEKTKKICCISGDKENLLYIKEYKCYISKNVVGSILLELYEKV
jgi:putative aminopeptidase FrvX